MKRRNRRRLLFAVVWALCIVFACGGAEFAARLWLTMRPDHMADAWVGKDYYTPQFVKEHGEMAQVIGMTDYGYEITKDYHGQYFNVDNLRRRTTDQPAHWRHTIWVFGASTVYGYDNPDWYTIPSYLQRAFNVDGGGYEVVNAGVITLTAMQQIHRLKAVSLAPGDIVIFYDGAVESLTPYLTEQNREGPPFYKSMCQQLANMAIAQALCDRADPEPVMLHDVVWRERQIADIASRYSAALIEAKGITEQAGATFYHVLQPTLYSMELSNEEREMAFTAKNTPTGNALIIQSWPDLQRINTQIGGIDLTHVLDLQRAAGEMLYLDAFHVNERGNATIAAAIVDVIAPTF